MAVKSEEQCSERLVRNWHSVPCQRRGTVVEEGKLWCKQHAPSAVKAREEARRTRWKLEYDAACAKRRLYDAAGALLEACKEALAYIRLPENVANCPKRAKVIKSLKAAIRAATKEPPC